VRLGQKGKAPGWEPHVIDMMWFFSGAFLSQTTAPGTRRCQALFPLQAGEFSKVHLGCRGEAYTIAEDAGISRQGVHDLIKRCNKTLEGYEAKLHLVEKFLSIKEKVHRMNELLEKEDVRNSGEDQLIQEIRKISGEIIEEL
jgi:predicted DNA-binding protein YlxM (UPF0122 family)